MTRLVVVLALLALSPGAWTQAALAQTYRWVDERGSVHYSQGLDSVPERFRATATPLRFPEPPPAPTPPPAGPAASGATVIEFTPGRPIVVTARLNDRENARLILDTGADRTVIAPRALVAAGVPMRAPAGRGRIQGATGAAEVESFTVESIQVGNARVGKMAIVSHDIASADTDGLLGRDFLSHFNVSIDNTAGKVTLAPK